jgi:chromosome segregation ATPase
MSDDTATVERLRSDAAYLRKNNAFPSVAKTADKAANELEQQARTIAEQASRLAELRGTLQELRIRLHAAGRRPEECYEMSLIDAAIDGAKQDTE